MSMSGCITGASTMMVVSWLEENEGPGMVETLFRRLNAQRGQPVSREAFQPRSKVDYRLHVDVLEQVADLAGADARALRTIGRNGADRVEEVVPGAKLLLRMASPRRLLKHAPKLWSTYADFGGVEVLECKRGRARLRIHGFQTHDHFCRTLEGFFEGLLERTGASDVSVREVEHVDADGCVFEGTWR